MLFEICIKDESYITESYKVSPSAGVVLSFTPKGQDTEVKIPKHHEEIIIREATTGRRVEIIR